MIVLPYLGKLSLQIRTRNNRVIKSKLSYCNIQIALQAKCKLINFFTFKNKIPVFLHFGIVYKSKCSDCNANYYGKPKSHFKVRMCEHLGVSALTRKILTRNNHSAIKDAFDNFSIKASKNNDFKVTLMRSLLINRDYPPSNSNRHSIT